jgi:hypothetical protein
LQSRRGIRLARQGCGLGVRESALGKGELDEDDGIEDDEGEEDMGVDESEEDGC